MTDGQEARKACALNLWRLAAEICILNNSHVVKEACDDNEDVIGMSGALAEMYMANLEYLSELLKAKYNRETFTRAETVAHWRDFYGWIVSHGERPPIVIEEANGTETPLSFEKIHSTVLKALFNVRAFRREISEKKNGKRM